MKKQKVECNLKDHYCSHHAWYITRQNLNGTRDCIGMKISLVFVLLKNSGYLPTTSHLPTHPKRRGKKERESTSSGKESAHCLIIILCLDISNIPVRYVLMSLKIPILLCKAIINNVHLQQHNSARCKSTSDLCTPIP